MIKENWMWVIGFEGFYEISDIGNVRSYKGLGRSPKIQSVPRLITPCKDGRGYYNFTVNDNGKKKVLYIHVEEAKAFVPNPNNYKFVIHINEIKTDNSSPNLAWGTQSDNTQDAIRNNKHPKKNDFSEALILFMYSSPHSACSVARRYSVSPSMVTKIRTGRSYGWLTGHKFIKQ